MDIVWVDEAGSTNTLAAQMHADHPAGVIVAARRQTAGRGQRGNSWEAEPGKNLTFSAVWTPVGVHPRSQFAISEAVALAVCDLLAVLGVDARVKWPNDIYVDDRKICGILIEHAVMGTDISRTVAGVGINVNQTEFLSDAPNPVSLRQLTGEGYELKNLLERYADIFAERVAALSDPEYRESIHTEFRQRLWRGDGGVYPFRQRESGMVFAGRIVDVAPEGLLMVEDVERNETKGFAFKEVEFIISR